LRAGAVEEDGKKADGDMQDLAGDLMPVNLWTLAATSPYVAYTLTKDRHFWWIGIKPRGLGLLLISLQ
jgi:hypothetical protein